MGDQKSDMKPAGKKAEVQETIARVLKSLRNCKAQVRSRNGRWIGAHSHRRDAVDEWDRHCKEGDC